MQLRASTEINMGENYNELIDKFYDTVLRDDYNIGTIYEALASSNTHYQGDPAPTRLVPPEPVVSEGDPEVQSDTLAVQGRDETVREEADVHMEPATSIPCLQDVGREVDNEIQFIEVEYT